MSYLTAFLSIRYSVESVLIAASTTAFVSMIIFFVAACTKVRGFISCSFAGNINEFSWPFQCAIILQYDLTRHAGAMLILSLVGIVGILVMAIASHYTSMKSLQMAIAIVGALMISMVQSKNKTIEIGLIRGIHYDFNQFFLSYAFIVSVLRCANDNGWKDNRIEPRRGDLRNYADLRWCSHALQIHPIFGWRCRMIIPEKRVLAKKFCVYLLDVV